MLLAKVHLFAFFTINDFSGGGEEKDSFAVDLNTLMTSLFISGWLIQKKVLSNPT